MAKNVTTKRSAPAKSLQDVEAPLPDAVPVFAGLQARLEAGRDAARDAWAASARDTLDALFHELLKGVEGLEARVPSVRCEDDALRLRAELAEFLRGAAAAIGPRQV